MTLIPRLVMFPGIVSSLTKTVEGTVAVFMASRVGIVTWRTEDASQKQHSWAIVANIRCELDKPFHSARKALATPNRHPRVP